MLCAYVVHGDREAHVLLVEVRGVVPAEHRVPAELRNYVVQSHGHRLVKHLDLVFRDLLGQPRAYSESLDDERLLRAEVDRFVDVGNFALAEHF